jgi:hypothetical protein
MSWQLAPYCYVSSQFLDAVRSALGCAGQVIMKKIYLTLALQEIVNFLE